ncbi:hypothetical protein ACFE04_024503 [Oxalis oulophora]
MEVMSFQQTDFNFTSRFSTTDDFSEDFENKLKMKDDDDVAEEERLVIDNDDDDDDSDEEDFSFAAVNHAGSPISADEIFEDGQIRPVFPIFGRDMFDSKSLIMMPPVKKLFIEEPVDDETFEPAGPFCEWRGKTVHEASPDSCRKSNSTGFSKLRRFRERVLKSNSDGKDAFVFLNDANDMITNGNGNGNNESEIKKEEKEKKSKKNKNKKKEESTALTAYMKSKAKENDKRRVYLPYKQVGFFTNVNGLTRNVHPF